MRSLDPTRVTVGLVAVASVLAFVPRRANVHSGTASSPHPTARVGLVFDVGGRGDKSFNDAAYRGLLKAERDLGVATTFIEPSGTEDREAALRLFAARGFDLVIGVGFIFSNDVDEVAKSYPNVHFACIDYTPGATGTAPNVAGLAFREEEGAFLVGAVAGLLSKSHHVGFVGGMTIPLIKKFEVGYGAGVKRACPACVVHNTYAGASPDAFKDPAKGKALAISEIAEGADILFHAAGSTGHGVFEGARDGNVLAIGVDSDQYDDMPGTVVTSMVKRADVAVVDIVRAVLEHRFQSGMSVLGLKEEGIDYVHDGVHGAGIPDTVKERVEGLRSDIITGRIRVPSE